MEDKTSAADAIMIVDGLFLQKPELSSFWDLTILLQVDDEIAIERGARRDAELEGDVEAVRWKYANRFIPSQKIYYAERQPQQVSDIVIDNTALENPKVVRGL